MKAGNAAKVCAMALAIPLLIGGCGDPEPGSRDDLEGHVDSIRLPKGMVELDHLYTPSCPVTCPTLVVWYHVSGPVEEMRVRLIEAMTEAGWDVNEVSADAGVYSASTDDHILFVTTNPQMLARNTYAPPGTKAEISIQLLRDPTS